MKSNDPKWKRILEQEALVANFEFLDKVLVIEEVVKRRVFEVKEAVDRFV